MEKSQMSQSQDSRHVSLKIDNLKATLKATVRPPTAEEIAERGRKQEMVRQESTED